MKWMGKYNNNIKLNIHVISFIAFFVNVKLKGRKPQLDWVILKNIFVTQIFTYLFKVNGGSTDS